MKNRIPHERFDEKEIHENKYEKIQNIDGNSNVTEILSKIGKNVLNVTVTERKSQAKVGLKIS